MQGYLREFFAKGCHCTFCFSQVWQLLLCSVIKAEHRKVEITWQRRTPVSAPRVDWGNCPCRFQRSSKLSKKYKHKVSWVYLQAEKLCQNPLHRPRLSMFLEPVPPLKSPFVGCSFGKYRNRTLGYILMSEGNNVTKIMRRILEIKLRTRLDDGMKILQISSCTALFLRF